MEGARLTWTPVEEKEPDQEPAFDGFTDAMAQLPDLRRWMRWVGGPVSARDVRLDLAGTILEVLEAEVSGDGLMARALWREQEVEVEGRLDGLKAWDLRVAVSPGGLAFNGRLQPAEEGWELSGALRGRDDQGMNLSAGWGSEGWWPEDGSLAGAAVELPVPEGWPVTAQLGLEGTWQERVGSLVLQLEGVTTTNSPVGRMAWKGDTRLRFEREGLELERLEWESDLLQVRLEEPVRMGWRDLGETPAAVVRWNARLDRIPSSSVAGSMEGGLSLAAGGEWARPRITVTGEGRELSVSDVGLVEVSVLGTLDGTLARLDRLEVRTEEGGRLEASGTVDRLEETVSEARWGFEGPLPAGPTGLVVRAEGRVMGPWAVLRHEGSASTVPPWSVDPWKPVAVSLDWKGVGMSVDPITVRVTTEGASLEGTVTGGISTVRERTVSAVISHLRWWEPELEVLALAAPVAMELSWGREEGEGRLVMDPGVLEGAAGRVTWSGVRLEPARWQASAVISHLVATAAGRWMMEAPPWLDQGRLGLLRATIDWNEEVLQAEGELEAEVRLAETGGWGGGEPFRLTTAWASDAAGLHLSEARVTQGDREMMQITLRAPIRVVRGGPEGVHWEEGEGEWLGQGSLNWDAALLERVRTMAGIEVDAPNVTLEIAGPALKPQLELRATAGRLGPVPGTNGVAIVPGLERLDLQVGVDREGGIVSRAEGIWLGQRVAFNARLPWVGLRGVETNAEPLMDRWQRNLEARLRLPPVDLTAVTAPWREWIQPGGRLEADLTWQQGVPSGAVQVSGISTLPLSPADAVRDLTFRLVPREERVVLEDGRASLGGRPLNLSGWVAFPGWRSGPGAAEVRLSGTNFALVRSPDLLLRADLDVALVRSNAVQSPMVVGRVRLHDSVVLLDVRELVAVDLERADRRPPWFALTQPGLSGWPVQVRVEGERFARVLTPAFRGTLSADLGLRGTLGQPRLLGEVVVDDGVILFPFGQLAVANGRVSFPEADPYRPRLEGRAEGLNYGYALSLDLGGTLSEPEIGFSSVPPMSTAEALQLLTAGTPPRREYTVSDAGRVQRLGSYLAGGLITTLRGGDPAADPRLTIRSGERVTAEGRLTYSVEYRLSERWHLVGEYDRWSQFNAGIRWRVVAR
jgi:translocation and assembly module TamB